MKPTMLLCADGFQDVSRLGGRKLPALFSRGKYLRYAVTQEDPHYYRFFTAVSSIDGAHDIHIVKKIRIVIDYCCIIDLHATR